MLAVKNDVDSTLKDWERREKKGMEMGGNLHLEA
jgi:hypothetical protein